MELKELIKTCTDTLQEKVEEEARAENYSCTVNTDTGYVYIDLDEKGNFYELHVEICHENNEHSSPNLEAFLEDSIEVDWDAAEEVWRDAAMDEWESHGFRDEADFWYWKEGRR